MTNRCLADWLTLLETRHPCEIELGLERVSAVWQRYQKTHPTCSEHRKRPKIITVAGTNGKGSCIASMQALLLEHNYSVGVFTSPHFLHYNERICLSGQPVSDGEIVSAFETIESLREKIDLTYFEFNTLAALIIFDANDLDFILLEVGLGGRLDATNIIDPDVAVLTSIDLDHQQWLGETRSEIAREKLGIARPGKPLIIGEKKHPKGFHELVDQTGAQALWCGEDFHYHTTEVTFSAALSLSADISMHSPKTSSQLLIDNLPREGLLPINKLLGLQALIVAGIPLDLNKCQTALSNISLNGRQQEFIFQGKQIILDVAHNPAAAIALGQYLQCSRRQTGNIIAVASVLDDKDWSAIVDALSSVIDQWKIVELEDVSRAAKGHYLVKLLYNRGLKASLSDTVNQAFYEALTAARDDDKIVVFGSFHTVARAMEIISAEVSSE
jgi:dihydrofolate synthase/folylpolyglutamate synthase